MNLTPQATLARQPGRRTHFIIERLSQVLSEMEQQSDVVASHAAGSGGQPLDASFLRIWQSIEVSGDWGLAYESIVADLETLPFRLSGKSAIALLEVGLLLQFKTSRDTDHPYDFRSES
jgi:hypothetical protein